MELSVTSLENKVAVITGAARGIGYASAGRLAARGASVVIADLNEEAAKTAAETIDGGKRVVGIGVDVGSPDSIHSLMEKIDRLHSTVDILVNNAGGSGGKTPSFLETPLEDWERTHRINLTGAFLMAQATARRMVASGSGGAIINITSISGQRGGEGRAAYGSSKAGLAQLTRVMAVELAQHKIRVNGVAPGPIDTQAARISHHEASRAAYHYLVPMRRYGVPEEVADAVAFLASDESRYITGHILNVDGGFGAAGLMTSATPPA